MSSSRHSELLDLTGLEITAEDVVALRRLRERRCPSLLERPELLAPAWPPPADLATRPTAAGREPVEL